MSCFMPPPCSFCKHYFGEDESQDRECRAFKEIPDDIITGDCDHTTPYPNDNNIIFELREELKADYEEVKLMKNSLLQFIIEEKSEQQSMNTDHHNTDSITASNHTQPDTTKLNSEACI